MQFVVLLQGFTKINEQKKLESFYLTATKGYVVL